MGFKAYPKHIIERFLPASVDTTFTFDTEWQNFAMELGAKLQKVNVFWTDSAEESGTSARMRWEMLKSWAEQCERISPFQTMEPEDRKVIKEASQLALDRLRNNEETFSIAEALQEWFIGLRDKYLSYPAVYEGERKANADTYNLRKYFGYQVFHLALEQLKKNVNGNKEAIDLIGFAKKLGVSDKTVKDAIITIAQDTAKTLDTRKAEIIAELEKYFVLTNANIVTTIDDASKLVFNGAGCSIKDDMKNRPLAVFNLKDPKARVVEIDKDLAVIAPVFDLTNVDSQAFQEFINDILRFMISYSKDITKAYAIDENMKYLKDEKHAAETEKLRNVINNPNYNLKIWVDYASKIKGVAPEMQKTVLPYKEVSQKIVSKTVNTFISTTAGEVIRNAQEQIKKNRKAATEYLLNREAFMLGEKMAETAVVEGNIIDSETRNKNLDTIATITGRKADAGNKSVEVYLTYLRWAFSENIGGLALLPQEVLELPKFESDVKQLENLVYAVHMYLGGNKAALEAIHNANKDVETEKPVVQEKASADDIDKTFAFWLRQQKDVFGKEIVKSEVDIVMYLRRAHVTEFNGLIYLNGKPVSRKDMDDKGTKAMLVEMTKGKAAVRAFLKEQHRIIIGAVEHKDKKVEAKRALALKFLEDNKNNIAVIELEGGVRGGKNPELEKEIIEALESKFKVLKSYNNGPNAKQILVKRNALFISLLDQIEKEGIIEAVALDEGRRWVSDKNGVLFKEWVDSLPGDSEAVKTLRLLGHI
jgi:hypothetical protein